jgi:CHAD domain-containing protein
VATNLPGPAHVIGWPPIAQPDLPAIAARLESLFDRECRDLADAARRTRRGADAEAIHDLRVAIRRLLAFLALWRPLLRERERRQAGRRLRLLRRRLGRARELEVQTRLLSERTVQLAMAARGDALQLLSALEAKRDRRRTDAARRASKSRMTRIRAALDDAPRALSARLLREPGALDHASSRLQTQERRAKGAIAAAIATGDDVALHAARVALKKWRYMLECHASANAREISLAPIKALQERLGDWNDERGLVAVVLEAAREGRAGTLVPWLAGYEEKRRAVLEALPELAAQAFASDRTDSTPPPR